jgi:CubicO group peptidase (beta-lactamase class C family)
LSKRKHLLCAFLVLFFFLKGPARALASSGQKDLVSLVDQYVEPYVKTRNFSGSVLLARNGKVFVSKGYGMANYELDVPNMPQTKFHIASVSKTFTAAAIMILAERGLVSPGDPVAKLIPGYPNGDRLTVHHLLVHTSGIPNINDFPDYDRISRFPQTPKTLVDMFKDKPLVMTPGERYSYSNSNYNLLAYIIETLSGQRYGEFLARNIFEPLGMTSSGHDGNSSALLKGRAAGYIPTGVSDFDNAPFLDWSAKTGNGSLYSTVEDLYKWDRALYAERILKKPSLDKVFTDHVEGTGYGWFVGRRLNRRIVRMNGRSPGFQCELQRYIDDDACVIVLGNNYAGTASLMADNLAAILFGEPHDSFTPLDSSRVEESQASPYIGRYEGGEDFIRPGASLAVEWKDGHLWLNWGPGYVSALIPLTGQGFLDRLFGGHVTFVKNTAGKVDCLVWHLGRDYPAKKALD